MLHSPHRFGRILHEFRHHLPFTIGAVIVALAALGIWTEVSPPALAHDGHIHDHIHDGDHMIVPAYAALFHVFHPLHVLLSAAATSAMFWRYDRRLTASIVVSLAGSIGVCGVSDAFLPFLGGSLLGVPMDLHICLFEEPHLVIPFAVIGTALGIFAANSMVGKIPSIFSHSAHVMIATGATVMYLVGFGLTDWMSSFFLVFLIVTLSVTLPCCSSDILFPLLLVNKAGVDWCGGGCEHAVAPDVIVEARDQIAAP